MFKCAQKIEIMTDSQAIDVVTFDFMGTECSLLCQRLYWLPNEFIFVEKRF